MQLLTDKSVIRILEGYMMSWKVLKKGVDILWYNIIFE